MKKDVEKLFNNLSAGCGLYLESRGEDLSQFSLDLLVHIDRELIPVKLWVVDTVMTSLSCFLLVLKDPLIHKIVQEEYDRCP